MRILVAIDGSDAADRAVQLAAKLTKGLMGHLDIVHIVTGRDVPAYQLSDYALREHVTSGEVLNAFSEEKLRIARERVEALGVSDFQSASLSEWQPGDVAGSIIEVAHRNQADLIILGKRGLGRVSGLLLGSVSQKVVSCAPCPVIVVP